jgi:glycosyltransferase involved in cell wall biosynthesis
MEKRILIFSLAYYPHFVSGAEAAIREITDRINPSDIAFHMVTLRFDMHDPVEERIGNVTVHRVGFGPSYLSKMCFIPLAALRGLQLNRIHAFTGLWAMMTYMLFPVMLMRFTGARIPYVLTLQDGDPYEKVFGRWFIRPLAGVLDRGFRSAAVVQVISSYLGDWARARGYTGAIELVYNGADPRDVDGSVTEAERTALIEELKKDPNDVLLVNTARLEYQKGFDTTIRALSLLPEHVKFLIVGGGSEESRLRALADTLGVSPRIIFVPKVPRDRVSVYRAISDIFVAPSRSEGLGIAQLSALATPLPLISTTVGGLAEFVHEGDTRTAWVVPPDDPVAIARAVEQIIAHPEEVKEVGARTRTLIRDRFEWNGIAQAMQERIFSKLGEPAPEHRA